MIVATEDEAVTYSVDDYDQIWINRELVDVVSRLVIVGLFLLLALVRYKFGT